MSPYTRETDFFLPKLKIIYCKKVKSVPLRLVQILYSFGVMGDLSICSERGGAQIDKSPITPIPKI